MAVSEGSGYRDFTEAVHHITNGDQANQNNLRAPSIDLEKRTNALKDHSNYLEALINDLVGIDAGNIGGIQGAYNNSHHHNGDDSYLLDFQTAYNNGNKNAVIAVETNGSVTYQLSVGSNFTIKASDGTTLLVADNDTKTVTII